MKERWKVGKFPDETRDGAFTYYRIKQELTWRFFFRMIKTWFVPCNECQLKIEKLWTDEVSVDRTVLFDVYYRERFLRKVMSSLCIKDLTGIVEHCKNTNEIIIGNKDYEPPVELSRTWLDDDNSIVDTTKEEYDRGRGNL